MFTMDNVEDVNVEDVQKLQHEYNDLQMELSDLEKQANEKESVMSSLNADLKELRMKIGEKSMTLKVLHERLANIDVKKIREQIEEKRRD